MSKIEVRLNPDVQPSGSDLAVVNAARRSFNTRSSLGPTGNLLEKDKRLLEFLARGMTAGDFEEFCNDVPAPDTEEHRKELVEKLWEWRNTPTHDTPFDHPHVSFEVKAPIFVARQLVKHEYLVMSEFSRRYITDDIEFYEPDYWRKAAPNKKQGSLEEAVDEPLRKRLYVHNGKTTKKAHEHHNELAVDFYKELIDNGTAPEQARIVLPQSVMTEWTWSGSLGAFCKMCRLRLHPEAQYESRLVAQQVYEHLKVHYPVSSKVLIEGVL